MTPRDKLESCVTTHAEPSAYLRIPSVSDPSKIRERGEPVHTGLTRSLLDEDLAGAPADRVLALAFHHCHEMVFSTALRITGNAWDAEDVTQGVFVTLANRLDGIEDLPRIPGFLKQCAVHASMRHLRRKNWWRTRRGTLATLARDPQGTNNAHTTALVRQLLEHLDPVERAAVVLKYIDQHSYDEVAALIGTSVSTVRRRLESARKKLARLATEDVERAVVRRIGGDDD